MPTALVILAPGFEEIEASTPIDVLRRAGVDVTVVGLDALQVEGSRGLTFVADCVLGDAPAEVDLIVLPGGLPGATNLAASEELRSRLQGQHAAGRRVAAICAAPAVALAPTGLLEGKRATCYPSFEERFSDAVEFSEERVVVDGLITTSRGPGTALEFSLALVEQLVSAEAAAGLRAGMLV